MGYNTNTFIEKANIVHKAKYDYSLVNYINSKTKINIICKNHGVFKQESASHLMGFGCPKCKGEILRKARILSTNDFITKANKIHENKYNYDYVVYYNSKTKININCNLHGLFSTTPERH